MRSNIRSSGKNS